MGHNSSMGDNSVKEKYGSAICLYEIHIKHSKILDFTFEKLQKAHKSQVTKICVVVAVVLV